MYEEDVNIDFDMKKHDEWKRVLPFIAERVRACERFLLGLFNVAGRASSPSEGWLTMAGICFFKLLNLFTKLSNILTSSARPGHIWISKHSPRLSEENCDVMVAGKRTFAFRIGGLPSYALNQVEQ